MFHILKSVSREKCEIKYAKHSKLEKKNSDGEKDHHVFFQLPSIHSYTQQLKH